MAIILNDNIQINAGKPIDTRYLTSGNTAYLSTGATNAAIPIPLRYTGLTVNILGTEYWYKGGVANTNLIEKKYDSVLPTGDFITGGTNIGYFTGFTGIQILPITNLPDTNYNGNYYSIYNNYYRGTDGNIHVGTPSDGIPKRGYVKTAAPVKSWIWNEYTGSSNMKGWILVNGNISLQIGTFQNGYVYYPPSTAYTQTSWITGLAYNNGSNLIISTVVGSLTTGSTITIGGPVFAKRQHNNLYFRTIMTKTPNLLSVSNDEAFIYLSGATIIGSNVGTGVGVYKGLSGNTLQFRKLSGSGNTTITQVGDTIYISSTGGGSTGGTGTITGGTNGLSVSGANIKLGGILNQHTQINGVAVYNLDLCNINEFKASTAGVTTLFGVDNTGILMSVTGGSVSLEDNGGMKYAADYSANYTDRSLIDKGYLQSQIVSGSTYNLSSPAAITVGGITGGTVLTGKTSFQLFEELLVPTLYPTLTPPSNTIGISPSGTFEVGCIIPTVVITSTFNAGCINPQYSAACDKRSNGAYSHEFDGCQVTGSYVCPSLSVSKCAFSYLICSGAQTWCTHVHYSGGTQPKNNKGGNYCAPLPAGETACQNASLTGIYPYYYGKLTSGGRPPVTNALVTVGCIGKVVASSTGTVTVTFGSNSSEYTWLAIPQTSTSKTCWYVNALDNGCVNSAPSDKYPDECIIAITSAESCWVGVNYKVYMSGTVGAISAPIQFRN